MKDSHFNNKTLFIIRGIPGSGKTSFVYFLYILLSRIWSQDNKKILNIDKGFSEVSTDDFFTDEDGNYNFDPKKLEEAHTTTVEKVNEDMKASLQFIFVHNTFSQSWEAEPYFMLAKKYKYQVFVIETQNHFISEHGVPERSVDNMLSRWQDSITFNRLR